MQKFYKEYKKAQKKAEHLEEEPLSELSSYNMVQMQQIARKDRELSADEKKFLLAAERGDIATVKRYLDEANSLEKFNLNAVDPLGRSALLIAIEYENIEMIEVLLNNHVEVGEALLHAINEEFVEAVEMLLHYQDQENINDVMSQGMCQPFAWSQINPVHLCFRCLYKAIINRLTRAK